MFHFVVVVVVVCVCVCVCGQLVDDDDQFSSLPASTSSVWGPVQRQRSQSWAGRPEAPPATAAASNSAVWTESPWRAGSSGFGTISPLAPAWPGMQSFFRQNSEETLGW